MSSMEDSFQELSKSLGLMMDGVLGADYFRSSGRDTWDPSLNVYETPDHLIVCVELAGIRPGEMDVQVENGMLHIRGDRPKPTVPEGPGEISVHLMEIDSGRFHRKIPVPTDVDFSSTKAHYKNGYVWIVLPRVAANKTETEIEADQ